MDEFRGITIGVDVDGPCAQQLETWVQLHNIVYGGSLKVEDITDWDLVRFAHPDCGKAIYKLLEIPTFYDMVKPVPGFADGIRNLRAAGAKILYVSAGVPETLDMKMRWLYTHAPEFKWEDVIFCYDKSKVKVDVLIDDGPHNLEGMPDSVKVIRWIEKYNRGVAANAHIFGWDRICADVELALKSSKRRRVIYEREGYEMGNEND